MYSFVQLNINIEVFNLTVHKNNLERRQSSQDNKEGPSTVRKERA